jgi:hypothetical protein
MKVQIQQNSFNLTSNNPEILIMRYLRRIVPRLLHQWRGKSRGYIQKGHQDLYINRCGISLPLVFYSINLFSYEVSIKHRRGQEVGGDIKMEYFSD